MMFNTNDYSIPIISDDHVKKLGCGQHSPPNHWHSRRLYVGQKGADNWLNLVHHSSYPLQGADPFDLNKNRSAALDMISVATMVSLGAGDAHHDVPIVEQLQINMPRLKYIPLDISIYLLESAIQNLKTYVSIPAGLLCDFEQVPVSIIHMIADLSKKPILFSMLGGTVGNLDLGEKHFFETIHNLMGKNDRLLIDVPLAGPAWTAEEDPRYNKTEYTEEFMRFLVHGITESNGYLDSRTLMGAVKGRIDCRIGNRCDIADTKVITIFDRQTNQAILRFRRYDWRSIVQWLANRGFEIIFHRCSIKSDEDKFGMGIILLGPGRN